MYMTAEHTSPTDPSVEPNSHATSNQSDLAQPDRSNTQPPPHPGAGKDYLGDASPPHIPDFAPNGLPEGQEAPKQHGESPTGEKLLKKLVEAYKPGPHSPDFNEEPDSLNSKLNKLYG